MPCRGLQSYQRFCFESGSPPKLTFQIVNLGGTPTYLYSFRLSLYTTNRPLAVRIAPTICRHERPQVRNWTQNECLSRRKLTKRQSATMTAHRVSRCGRVVLGVRKSHGGQSKSTPSPTRPTTISNLLADILEDQYFGRQHAGRGGALEVDDRFEVQSLHVPAQASEDKIMQTCMDHQMREAKERSNNSSNGDFKVQTWEPGSRSYRRFIVITPEDPENWDTEGMLFVRMIRHPRSGLNVTLAATPFEAPCTMSEVMYFGREYIRRMFVWIPTRLPIKQSVENSCPSDPWQMRAAA